MWIIIKKKICPLILQIKLFCVFPFCVVTKFDFVHLDNRAVSLRKGPWIEGRGGIWLFT